METYAAAASSSQAPRQSLSLRNVAKRWKQWSNSVGGRKRSQNIRKHILRCAEDLPEGEVAEMDSQLMEDLVKFGGASRVSTASLASSQSQAKEAKFGLKEIVDKILIADFFLVIFALGWLTAGVFFKVASDTSIILDTWLFLWPFVFQPAIGVLMLGALTSGLITWLTNSEAKAN